MNRTALRVLAASLSFAALVALGGEFEYTIPAGWIDLKHVGADVDTSNIPVGLLRDAADFRYLMMAVDPRNTTATTVGMTMNAVEMRGASRVDADELMQYGDGVVAEMRAAGLKASMLDTRYGHAGNLAAGINTLQVEDANGLRKIRQYLIPGRKNSTIITFSAPFDEFGRYEPAIATAVNGTRLVGGGFSWGRMVLSGALAGLFGACLAIVIARARKRSDGTSASAAKAT